MAGLETRHPRRLAGDALEERVDVLIVRRHRGLASQVQGWCIVSGLRRPRPSRVSAVRRCRAHPAREEGQPTVRRRRGLEHTTQSTMSGKAFWRSRPRSSRPHASASPSRRRARRRSPEQGRRASEDVRFRSEFAAAIREQFPGCPADRAEAIALHTAARGSGRVGRSVAAGVGRRRGAPRRHRLRPPCRHRLRRPAHVRCRPRIGARASAEAGSRMSSTPGATVSRCSTRLESDNGLRGGMFVTPHHPGGRRSWCPPLRDS